MNKVIKYIKNPDKFLLSLINKGYFKMLPDSLYLKLKYRLIMGERLNLKKPITFNEKMQWLKLHDRNPLYTLLADKYESKNYVSKIVGESYVIPLLGVYDNFESIDFSSLPNKFVIKPTHTSGDVIICKDKQNLDYNRMQEIANGWLKKDYYKCNREWPYKNINRKIIVEEFLGSGALIDYRIWCFNGKAKYIYQYINEAPDDGSKPEPTHCNIYDTDWRLVPFHQAFKPTQKKYKKPDYIDTMIELAEKLSNKIPFLRVDYYYVDNRIYIGELTFFPGAGLSKFHPNEYDKIVGDMIFLPAHNKKTRG